jgi:hypothetical protein
MRRSFGCHCMVHVRHAIDPFAGARARHRSLSEPGRQLGDSGDRQGSQIVRVRGVLWLILPFQLKPHFCQLPLIHVRHLPTCVRFFPLDFI